MEDRETPRMRKYGKSKTTRIMMAAVPQVTSGSGFREFQADGFLVRQSVQLTGFLNRSYVRYAVTKAVCVLYSVCVLHVRRSSVKLHVINV